MKIFAEIRHRYAGGGCNDYESGVGTENATLNIAQIRCINIETELVFINMGGEEYIINPEDSEKFMRIITAHTVLNL